MKMRLSMLAALSSLIVACSAPDGAREPLDGAHARAVSENLLAAVGSGDYATFSRDFSPELAQVFDPSAFADLEKRLGASCGEFQSVDEPWETPAEFPEVAYETDANFDQEVVHVWLWFEGDDPRLRGLWLDSPGLQAHEE